MRLDYRAGGNVAEPPLLRLARASGAAVGNLAHRLTGVHACHLVAAARIANHVVAVAPHQRPDGAAMVALSRFEHVVWRIKRGNGGS